jgi:hypothetical protein
VACWYWRGRRAQGVEADMPGDFGLSASVVVRIKRDVTEIELEVLLARGRVAS